VILTPDYKRVFAAFNTPVSDVKLVFDYPGVSRYQFTIWPFEYQVSFTAVDEEDTLWEVDFKLYAVTGTHEELQVYFQDFFQREVPLEEVPDIINEIEDRPFTNSNMRQEKEVFSTLFQIMGAFIQKENPQCFFISSADQKKFRVYQTMARRYLSNWVAKDMGDGGGGMSLCQRGNS